MATILKCENREFQEDPNKIDNFRLFSDISRKKKGVSPKNLNFDLRLLNPDGFESVSSGDLIFFEMGESGAHQFYNHTSEPCTYLDIRTYIGYDVCEYPDSDKILLAPSFEIFKKESQVTYFEGEKNILGKWQSIRNNNNKTSH
jgi:hypothetical protein